jgi:hypothetical protein
VRHVAGFAFDFVFAEPVEGSVVKEHPAAVGVDVNSVVVVPELAGEKACIRGCRHEDLSCGLMRQ